MSSTTTSNEIPLTQDSTKDSWQQRAKRKRAACFTRIPLAWRVPDSVFDVSTLADHETGTTNLIALNVIGKSGILTTRELEITERYEADDLLKLLSEGTITAVQTITAFSKRAAIAQQLTRCLTEVFFEQARERAEFLDAYLKKEGKPYGPLHGLPISIKDSFQVKGMDTTIGYVSFLDHGQAQSNSALVQMLVDLGAVLYVKTNIPQTMMTADSENNIFGRTLNPHNTAVTAGGSSGGEGALIALRGSILGVGTDIAGSIRIPALCCGDYGFRPTTSRIPYGGQVSPALHGLPGILPCAGPIAPSLKSLGLFMQTVLDAKPGEYDSSVHAVPWRRDIESKDRLRIGILPEDPVFPLHPPVKRAFKSATTALRQAGHDLISLPYQEDVSAVKATRLSLELFSTDPTQTPFAHIARSGEPAIQSILNGSQPAAAMALRKTTTIEGLAALMVERQNYCEKWRQCWVSHGLDAVIAPTAPNTACRHDQFGLPPYTVIWNLLDYPTVHIPYLKSSKALDPDPVEMKLPSLGPNYEPDISDNAPCGFSIVTRRFTDEECLQAADIVDRVLRNAKS